MAWHYTIRPSAVQILQDGHIKQATANIDQDEIPVTWFSTNQHFEPTAAKIVIAENRLATFDEMAKVGLFRFGIPVDKLAQWDKLIQIAKIPPHVVLELEHEGHIRGANSVDWYGTIDAVPIEQIEKVEYLTNGAWQPASYSLADSSR